MQHCAGWHAQRLRVGHWHVRAHESGHICQPVELLPEVLKASEAAAAEHLSACHAKGLLAWAAAAAWQAHQEASVAPLRLLQRCLHAAYYNIKVHHNAKRWKLLRLWQGQGHHIHMVAAATLSTAHERQPQACSACSALQTSVFDHR